jgi:anti-sigma factor RsiW
MQHLPDEVLYGYADEILPEAERKEATRHLRACALCQARLARSRALTRALKAQLGQAHAPTALRTSIRSRVEAPDNPRAAERTLPRARLGALVLGLGFVTLMLAVVVFARRAGQPPTLLGELAAAHAQLAQDPALVQVRGDAGAISAWFAPVLHEQITAPDIQGLQLVGGRLDQIEGQPAANLVYRQDDGATMSLLVWRGSAPLSEFASQTYERGRFYVGAQDGQTVIIWPVDDVRYACVSAESAERVLDMAGRVRRSLGK